MGLFNKLFEKKECSVCDGEIGILGNRKLEDGNLCKKCNARLSPFFMERRHSTVEDIKAQLAYREENKQKLSAFHPNKQYGRSTKVYVDTKRQKFIVTEDKNWSDGNPDLIDISQVKEVKTEVYQSSYERFTKDKEGNTVRYDPPRYRYEYSFKVDIFVDSPWFERINVDLNFGDRATHEGDETYHRYEKEMNELAAVLRGEIVVNTTEDLAELVARTVELAQAKSAGTAADGWTCSCGVVNTGKFCCECGTKKPETDWICSCGAVNTGKFCQECGNKKV